MATSDAVISELGPCVTIDKPRVWMLSRVVSVKFDRCVALVILLAVVFFVCHLWVYALFLCDFLVYVLLISLVIDFKRMLS